MSDEWMYQSNGRDIGPVSFSQLQDLINNGILTPNSEVRSARSFSWQRASFVEGLKFSKPVNSDSRPAVKASSEFDISAKGADDWYYRVGTIELGPLTFVELTELAKNQQLSADDDVKLGASGKWRRVASIGRLVAALPYQVATPAEPASPAPAQPQITPQPQISPTPKPRKATPAQISVVDTPKPQPTASRPKSSPVVAVVPAPVSQGSMNGEELVQRVEECLEALNKPGKPQIGYSLENGVVTVRGVVASVGEQLLVMRRLSSVAGVVRVVDSLTVSAPAALVPTPASTTGFRPQPAKRSAPQQQGSGLVERLKETISGEYGKHVIGLAVAVTFLGYWYFPRSPVRPVAVHPVKGSVVIDGKPLANAAVVLHPVGQTKKLPPNLHPHAKAAPDGSFALETFDPADGAPDGEFVATVFLVAETEVNGEKNYSGNLLPAVYSDPGTSPIRVKITSATKILEPLQLITQ